jgi:hypothetical protein
MPDFSKLIGKAKQLAGKHPDQVNKGMDKAANVAEEKSGGKYDSQIQQGEQRAEDYLGTGGEGQNPAPDQPPNQ